MLGITYWMKKALRLPADALIASSQTFPARVEECLRVSPALRELLATRPAAAGNGSAILSQVEAEADAEAGPYKDFLAEADRLGMDVNDYLEKNIGWGEVLSLVNRSVSPFLQEDSIVLELGAGTGRWSREILKKIPYGQLHLVDYSSWFVQFQADYFKDDPRVVIHQTNGISLPIDECHWADVCCSYGTFIMLKLGNVYRYAKEFRRVLKPGGHFVVEYMDIESPEGWEWMLSQSNGEHEAGCFVYYTPAIMKRVFAEAGLEVIRDDHVGLWYPGYNSRWLIGRSPT